MANRGIRVTLALVSALLADAEIAFRESRQEPRDRLPMLAVRSVLQLSIFFASKSDTVLGWMYVMRDFLNFPVLYSFCYGYLNAVDPEALFGELVGGVVFFFVQPSHFRSPLLPFASLRFCFPGQTTVRCVESYMNRLTSVVWIRFTRVVQFERSTWF